MPQMFTCKCGAKFTSRKQLAEHIGILNARWPRSSPDDEHAPADPVVEKARALAKRLVAR